MIAEPTHMHNFYLHIYKGEVICNYRRTSNISRTLFGNKIVDYSDVVGASPIGTAPPISSFSTQHLASIILQDKTRNI